ncbi:hypothetical protein PENPOL_c003G08564 [Penicillium polonicum]|uniref:Uncharacterized protein n=1 Tax=Penicillium polonicum TaxID=60169 RepID=A0A1V6NTS1_PENPO|nr:hypothetical protein PENPOL_c003G08564 [Penicillium polonicum]
MSSMYESLLTVWHDALALAMAESVGVILEVALWSLFEFSLINAKPTSSLLVRLAPFFRRLRLIHRCTVMLPASTIAVPVAAGYFPVPGYFSEMLFILLFILSTMASAESFPGARFKKVG